MDQNPANKEENADFARGLFVCERIGIEFASAGSSGIMIPLIATQAFATMFFVPILGFFVLRNVFGVVPWVAGVLAGALSIVIVAIGLRLLMRVNMGQSKRGAILKNESDSRYRVRAIVPKKRQHSKLVDWASLASGGRSEGSGDWSEDDLKMVRGGFEPVIVRPWFGIKRSRAYWWTFALMSVVVGLSAVYMLTFVFGGWKGLMQSFGLMGYALTGLAMVGGLACSELIWPVYVRLVPGQLDIFRYGFLGSGEAKVERFDLRKAGVCANFGGYVIAIEPEREVGTALPSLVASKRWPHAMVFPDSYQPMYFSVGAVPTRREFTQRLIQAARTDEPTPPVSMERLGE